jgi:tyrosine aminotransferase
MKQHFKTSIYGSLQQVQDGARRLAQIILGASHLAQIAIPSLLLKSEESSSMLQSNSENSGISLYIEVMKWKSNVRDILQQQAMALCDALKQIGPCLDVIEPQGAMYAMVRISIHHFDDMIQNDLDFMKLLLEEENVIVLPGTCFGFPNSFRVVFCSPVHILIEAAHRMGQFCHRHLSGVK